MSLEYVLNEYRDSYAGSNRGGSLVIDARSLVPGIMHANIAKIVPIGITIVATTTAWRETKSPKFATLEMLLASDEAEMVPSTSGGWLRGS